MASITLKFIPPENADIAALRVYESPVSGGPWTQIDRTTAIGTYPNYIVSYTTDKATSAADWFAIAWEDVAGDLGNMSEGMQGGTVTLLAEVTDLALEKAPNLDPTIVANEAEAVIWYYAQCDPHQPRPAWMTDLYVMGLSYMTLAQAIPFQTISTEISGGSADAWVAGLVSVKKSTLSSSSSSQGPGPLEKLALWLERTGKRYLGISDSRVLQMKEISVAGGYRQIVRQDTTRSIIEIAVVD